MRRGCVILRKISHNLSILLFARHSLQRLCCCFRACKNILTGDNATYTLFYICAFLVFGVTVCERFPAIHLLFHSVHTRSVNMYTRQFLPNRISSRVVYSCILDSYSSPPPPPPPSLSLDVLLHSEQVLPLPGGATRYPLQPRHRHVESRMYTG